MNMEYMKSCSSPERKGIIDKIIVLIVLLTVSVRYRYIKKIVKEETLTIKIIRIILINPLSGKDTM